MIAADVQHTFLAAGNIVDATNYAAFVHHKLGDTAESAVLSAMVERFHGRFVGAHVALDPVLDGSLPALHPITAVWAWLEATTLAAERDTDTAFTALRNALTVGESQKLLRPFTYSQRYVRTVLDRNFGRFGTLDGFAAVVRAAVKPGIDTSVVRLSPREMDLLRELPSFRTAESIAADKFISVNTVKTHLRGIYRKLGVTNRRDAIAAAQKLGMI
ncbi:LuxR C-terminal-related transcriptional regulator [Rhodococcus sp. G-MC3]|uniref:helix-turn-helix transcriptional regulator n=1 Tax=Rhodococcus sp. G-MC3 TaxID=3046209 RepID=UPI0024BA0A53|nr:helix-turn-helix transcriptional regulator [Rhodococcus sp. G-MC3]MDJ0395135.1 LuxR C-terminal-related transcriptional regulator [Rhodococcus sp. G-MC3]